MSKLKVIIGAIAALVLVGGGVAGAYEVKNSILFKDGNEVVTEAIKDFALREEETALEKALSTKKLTENIKEKGAEGEFSLQVNSIGEESAKVLEGLQGEINFASDVENKKNYAKISGTYAGVSADIENYADSEKLQIGSSLLDGKVLQLAYADGNLMDKLKNSPVFGAYMEGMDDAQLQEMEKYLANFQDIIQKGFEEAETPEDVKELEKIFEDFKNNWEIEKTDKKEFTVNDKEKKYQGYEVVISKENIASLTDALIDWTVKETENNTFLKAYLELISVQAAGLTEEEMSENLDKAKEEIRTLLEDNVEDVILNVYVTHYGKLVAIEAEAEVQEQKYEVSVKCLGGQAIYSNMEIEFTCDIEGTEVGAVVEFTEDKDGSVITNEVALKVKSGATVELGSVEFSYDTKSDEFEGSIVPGKMLVGVGTDFKVVFSGEVEEYKAGSVIDMNFDEITVNYNGQNLLSCSGGYALRIVEDVKELSGESMDVLSMDEMQWMELSSLLMEKLQGLQNLQ